MALKVTWHVIMWLLPLGYLKGRVYTHKPRNLGELKDAIQQEVLTIDQQLLAWAMDDFKRRIENCIQEDGRHLNDIIFHTWIPNSNGMFILFLYK